MKRFLSIILLVALVMSFAACGSNNAGGKTYKIGICNYVDDASLNQIVDSIKKQLEQIGKDKNVTFDIKVDNCNADANVMSQIIANFIADKVDIMVGIATPVAMNMQAMTEDNNIPVVFAAVSDPVGAGLVDSLEKPGHNITGTSDFLDTNAVMNLILAANPGIKKVGLLYDVGQDASTAAIASAKAFLQSKNIEFIEKSGTKVDEVVLAANALVNEKVEAVFTPTDNTIMLSELSIYDIFADAKIPHYTGADSFALNGAFLGYGVDYENLGYKTADMIADILINGKKIADYPVMTFDNGTATINTETAERIGFNFDDLKTVFAPYCSKIQSIKTAESFDDIK